ncbi:hypothetical protein Y11_00551 [Yersinia enterocolitica subsp. palearctica Y11]|uniref:Uncharacterized protein n=2 Tax=Yersinia enterocolitica TaxID=630 RepID=A0A0H3NU46_YERE1|nr:unknown protein [Yersinia enterocolitica W22703]CBY28126.1 hypothetical protein Y11_00551 [Yersinia enterocolitica subsp. palearctica Y11]
MKFYSDMLDLLFAGCNGQPFINQVKKRLLWSVTPIFKK